MSPELEEVILGGEGTAGGLCDALENLGKISQVVNVMRFCGSWQQFL
jgi:hypothetical protein